MSFTKEQVEVFQVAQFGIEVERFFNSDVGQFILNRAEMDKEAAIREMKTVDPADVKEVQRIKDGLVIPDKIVSWLTEAINAGLLAEAQIREEEAE